MRQRKISIEKRKELPSSPGVYFFVGKQGEILYIGKATNLRSRVAQYFSGNDSRGERIFRMVSQSKTLLYIPTETVLEAVIVEANSIKKFQPRYNIELRDDKSFSFIGITKETFPRCIFLRERDIFQKETSKTLFFSSRKNTLIFQKVYGPYTSRYQAEIVLKIVRKIFPFHSTSQKTEKGCLYYQIGLCPGPYAEDITHQEYRRNIQNVRYVLEGKKKRLLLKLEREMKHFAKEHEYEKATKRRDEIFALQHIQDIALLTKEKNILSSENTKMRLECYDVSHISGKNPVASMIVFEDGELRPQAYRKFSIQGVSGIDDVAMMREVLARRFRHKEWSFPNAVILDGGKGHLSMAEQLFQSLDIGVPLIAVAKGPTRKKVDLHISKQFSPSEEIYKDGDLLEKLREEAHRFAISFHRKQRSRDFLEK
ncbi:MAG: hypothetical protein EOM19_00560 [Candidatus Moranbacteria bacterium]|nr:hypothetical protein [Candidatus Moranbacteria bacterium]